MALYKAEGIVLRTRAWGEADRIVTLLSPERGKFTVMAKGARRPRNRMAAGMQLFSYGEMLLTTGTTLDSINQVEIKDSFRDLRDDLDKMIFGAYITELVDELLPEHESDEGAFLLVLNLVQLMRHRNPRIVAVIATIKLLTRAGYRPHINHCVCCNNTDLLEKVLFSSSLGGPLCIECKEADPAAIVLDRKSLEWLERLRVLNIQNPDEFSLSAATLKDIEYMLEDYIRQHLEKDLKAAKLLTILGTGGRN